MPTEKWSRGHRHLGLFLPNRMYSEFRIACLVEGKSMSQVLREAVELMLTSEGVDREQGASQ